MLGEEAAASPLESGGTWAWDDERPGRMSAWGDAGGGWLVWSQVFDGGWEAYVNGERAELRRANHAFQAVALPAGAWRADFLYRPKGLFWAMALAALCAALLAAAGLRRLKRAEGA